MADGADRVLGAVQTIAERMGGSGGASTGPLHAQGEVYFANDSDPAITVNFNVDEETRLVSIQAAISFEIPVETGLEVIQAVWEGAASKGFPKKGWKH